MTQHKKLTEGKIHVPNQFVYGDEASRIGAAISNPDEINKIALQLDNGSYWRLISVNPAVWGPVNTTPLPHTQNISTINGLDAALRNEAGQIKANYTGLQLVGFTAGVVQNFNISAITPTLSSSPTTTFPYSSPTDTYVDIFDASRGTSPTGRLIENPIAGQVHFWRVQGSYANKAAAQLGALSIYLRNLVSGFFYETHIALADGITADSFNALFISIADGASIPSPNGYVLQAQTSFNDPDLTISISSITRISMAVGNNGVFT